MCVDLRSQEKCREKWTVNCQLKIDIAGWRWLSRCVCEPTREDPAQELGARHQWAHSCKRCLRMAAFASWDPAVARSCVSAACLVQMPHRCVRCCSCGICCVSFAPVSPACGTELLRLLLASSGESGVSISASLRETKPLILSRGRGSEAFFAVPHPWH